MDVGSIRHPKRRALWRNAAFIALLTLLIATVAGSHARADGPVATPDGVFVTGDTTGLNVSAVEPGLTVDLYEIADSVADPVALSDPPPGNFKHTLWGYEASLGGARLLQYTILPGVVPGPSCVPIHAAGLTVSGNGRGVGTDTLAAFRNTTLPGSSKYLLTDAGELTTVPNTLALIDQADCHGGQMVTPIMEFAKATPMSGIDFEWPGLLAANLSSLFNNGDKPFTTLTLVCAWGNTFELEDISLCGFVVALGGDGNDMCTVR